jgi:hypothetical protein
MRSAHDGSNRYEVRMGRRTVAAIFCAALAPGCLLSAPASAQPQERSRQGLERGPRAEDLRETLTILMMVRMKNELNLSKEQYEQVLPKVEEMEKARQGAAENRRALRARLRALFSQENAPESTFSQVVEKFAAEDDAEQRREQSFFSDLRKILSPRQQAQFLVFRQRFRGWLQERMRQMREMRAGRAGRFGMRPGPGAVPGEGGAEDEEGEEAEPAPPK